MTFILDNLIAILVGSVLLAGLLVVQHRGQQRSVEATTRYQAQQYASGFTSTLERDIENARSHEATDDAFEPKPGSGMVAASTRRFSIRRSDDDSLTSQFSFPTLTDPSLGTASPIQIVTYHVEPTGDSTLVNDVMHPLYKVMRYVYERGGPVQAGRAMDQILDFEITAFAADGAEITETDGVDEIPPRIGYEVVTAINLPTRLTGDQSNGSGFASTRSAAVVRVRAATARGGFATVDATKDGGIPALPGDDGFSTPTPTPDPDSEPVRLGL